MRTLIVPLAVLLLAAPAQAQLYIGEAAAISGDTLLMGEQIIRLQGIDAPVPAQTCSREDGSWPCGEEAKKALTEAIAGQSTECLQESLDALNRAIARCKAGRFDLADMMLRRGLAVSSNTASEPQGQIAARNAARGLWVGQFEPPAVFRQRDPQWQAFEAKLRKARSGISTGRSGAPAEGVHYRGCREVWAHLGRALHSGEPGYRADMDGDHDGVACEKRPL